MHTRQADGWFRSYPIRVRMLGMDSDTFRMQQAGWEFTVDERIEYRAFQVIARHKDARMYAASRQIPFEYFADAFHRESMLRGMTIDMCYVGSSMSVVLAMDSHVMNFKPVDMAPQMYMRQQTLNIEDLAIFAAPLTRTQEIIVPEDSVSSLLDRILEFKQDIDPEYARMKVREGERIDGRPQQKFHAQILSLVS